MTDVLDRTAPAPASGEPAPDEPAGRGADAGWRRVPVWARAALVAAAAVLAAELVVSLAGARTVPLAPTSPFSLGPQGTAGFVALARRVAPVRIDADPLAPGVVPAGGTLVVVDPLRWSAADAQVAAQVAAAGGRVVFVGAAPRVPGPALPAGAAVAWRDAAAGTVVRTAPGRLALGVRALVTGVGSLAVRGPVAVAVAGARGDVVASAGRVVWVGSSTPLRNANLDRLDDAALAWNLVAPWGRPVVLAVADQAPPATATGLRALPPWWLAALAVALLAAVVWLCAAARRFGPLEASARALAPPRAGHAEAMGALLAALPERHVAEVARPVVEAADRALRVRVGAPADATAAELAVAATDRDVPDWVLDAVRRTPATRDDAVHVGRALAWLEEGAPP